MGQKVKEMMDQVVDNMGEDYDKALMKEMRKSKNNRQYIGDEEVGEYDEAKVNDRMESDAAKSVTKKYGISKYTSGGSIKIKGNGIAKRGNNFKGIF